MGSRLKTGWRRPGHFIRLLISHFPCFQGGFPAPTAGPISPHLEGVEGHIWRGLRDTSCGGFQEVGCALLLVRTDVQRWTWPEAEMR